MSIPPLYKVLNYNTDEISSTPCDENTGYSEVTAWHGEKDTTTTTEEFKRFIERFDGEMPSLSAIDANMPIKAELKDTVDTQDRPETSVPIEPKEVEPTKVEPKKVEPKKVMPVEPKGGLSTGAIIGIIVAVLVAIIAGLYFFGRSKLPKGTYAEGKASIVDVGQRPPTVHPTTFLPKPVGGFISKKDQ